MILSRGPGLASALALTLCLTWQGVGTVVGGERLNPARRSRMARGVVGSSDLHGVDFHLVGRAPSFLDGHADWVS